MRKPLWMRPGARVLANGKPAEIVCVSFVTKQGIEHVQFIDVCFDRKDKVECFRPDAIQRDRMRREVSHV